MKNLTTILLTLIISLSSLTTMAQMKWQDAVYLKKATLNVLYFENKPFSYHEGENLKGLEVDLLEAFVQWAKKNKGIDISLNYKSYDDSKGVYYRIKVAVDNTVALGSYTIDKEKENEVDFSPPYLKHVSVLVTNGHVPLAQSTAELSISLSRLYVATVKGTVGESRLKDFRFKNELYRGEVSFQDEPSDVLNIIANNERYYGFSDLISISQFLKQKYQYIKMQPITEDDNQYYGFALPNKSTWTNAFNEFLESGFGFAATKTYREILNKNLDYEVVKKSKLN